MNKNVISLQDWLKSAKSNLQAASAAAEELNKQAADQEALTGIKDPTNKGTVSIPPGTADQNRGALGMPENNAANTDDASKEHNVMSVTKPDGVGQGDYPVVENGNAKDDAATSPGAPLSKIAQIAEKLKQAAGELSKQAAPDPAPAATEGAPAPAAAPAAADAQSKTAAAPGEDDFKLDAAILNDTALLHKLAYVGQYMLGTEEGVSATREVLERQAGVKEAAAIVSEVAQAISELEKQAAAPASDGGMDMQKAAAAEQAHAFWLQQPTIDKNAYVAGAADGDAMADTMEQGGDPTIPGAEMESLTDEQIIAAIQELIDSKTITPEAANAILEEIAAEGEAGQGISLDEAAEEIQKLVDSREITPEQATALAQQILAEVGASSAAPGPDAAPAEAVKAASCVNAVLGGQ